VTLAQNEGAVAVTVAAFKPMAITIRGEISCAAIHPDLTLEMTRVDGRRIWKEQLSTTGSKLLRGQFTVTARLDPFILGAALYRIDVTINDTGGTIDTATRVVEIIDEEGQHGGNPLIFYPPIVTSRPIEEANT
jgi:lipopolysaccharide transport system ATP-binding protein